MAISILPSPVSVTETLSIVVAACSANNPSGFADTMCRKIQAAGVATIGATTTALNRREFGARKAGSGTFRPCPDLLALAQRFA